VRIGAGTASFASLAALMADHYLLPTQKNEVFRAIEGAGLNPADFHWETVQSEIGEYREGVPALVYTSAGARCRQVRRESLAAVAEAVGRTDSQGQAGN
jgi:hypothetical protein